MDVLTALVSISICVVLPVMVVFLVTYSRTKQTKSRNETLLAILEKNTSLTAVEGVLQEMQNTGKKKGSMKSQIIEKLLGGLICLGMGIAFIAIYFTYSQNNWFIIGGFILLAIGIALVISYFIMKKWYAKEIEAEEVSAIDKKNSK